ncbi:MAG: hypothetical protein KF760_22860 [Candidatus Eremiobacteraeota bacterium]|nr:hypothetical protein [Candidatus Eremiobacteraeota bacterium]MCW5870196.1 hypothetical protein [Candidatus Eremiobacteraeota bacterium]
MSSIYLSDEVKKRLIHSARKRGFRVERGPQSQLGEYIEYLIHLDEQKDTSFSGQTLEQALGLLAVPGQEPVTDEQIERILGDRRQSL